MSQSTAETIITEIRIFPCGFTPKGWISCNGQSLPINQNQGLYALIGLTYGSDGAAKFRVPNLNGRVLLGSGNGYQVGKEGGEEGHVLTEKELPAHTHLAVASSNKRDSNTPKDNFWPSDKPYMKDSNTKINEASIGKTGGNEAHPNMAPYLPLNYCMAIDGIFPGMEFGDEEYIGTVKAYAVGNRTPIKAVPCDGRSLPINQQYTKLFTILGTKYGGDGRTTFNVPDLRGRAGIHWGQGEGLTHYDIGEKGGAAQVVLTEKQMASHRHTPAAKTSGSTPDANPLAVWSGGIGRPPGNSFASSIGTPQQMNPGALATAGENAPHNNMMPYQVMNYFIFYDGIYPPRN